MVFVVILGAALGEYAWRPLTGFGLYGGLIAFVISLPIAELLIRSRMQISFLVCGATTSVASVIFARYFNPFINLSLTTAVLLASAFLSFKFWPLPPTPPSWACSHCGYDRRGIGESAPCPECGGDPRTTTRPHPDP